MAFSILFLLDLCKEEHFKDSSACTFARRQGNNNNFHISLCLQAVKGDNPVVIFCPHTHSSSGGYSHSISLNYKQNDSFLFALKVQGGHHYTVEDEKEIEKEIDEIERKIKAVSDVNNYT